MMMMMTPCVEHADKEIFVPISKKYHLLLRNEKKKKKKMSSSLQLQDVPLGSRGQGNSQLNPVFVSVARVVFG